MVPQARKAGLGLRKPDAAEIDSELGIAQAAGEVTLARIRRRPVGHAEQRRAADAVAEAVDNALEGLDADQGEAGLPARLGAGPEGVAAMAWSRAASPRSPVSASRSLSRSSARVSTPAGRPISTVQG